MQATWQGQWQHEADTAAFGRALAKQANAGDCLALIGEMGAGKTTLTRAIAESFGVDIRQQFGSPTYTYANEYQGHAATMVHIDLYRVPDEPTAITLGLGETLARDDAFVVVEWADKLVPLLPRSTLWLRIQADWQEGGGRTWRAKGPASVGERLLGRRGEPS